MDLIATDDGSRTLWSEKAAETFHSGCGAVAESLVVYLLHSGVAERLRQKLSTRVLEVGLGTGTDFLLAAAVAEYYQTPLKYVALENELLGSEILHTLHNEALWPIARQYCLDHDLPELANAFNFAGDILESFCAAMGAAQERYESNRSEESEEPLDSRHRTSDWTELRIIHGDATRFVAADYGMVESNQAVFFDPFSPENAPELWTESMFARVTDALQPGGRLTTYCVKGTVRRQLISLGFSVAKLPGPTGGKREVLVATKQPAR